MNESTRNGHPLTCARFIKAAFQDVVSDEGLSKDQAIEAIKIVKETFKEAARADLSSTRAEKIFFGSAAFISLLSGMALVSNVVTKAGPLDIGAAYVACVGIAATMGFGVIFLDARRDLIRGKDTLNERPDEYSFSEKEFDYISERAKRRIVALNNKQKVPSQI